MKAKDLLDTVADLYAADLFDDQFDDISIRNTFEEIVKDYNKMARKCRRQGYDIDCSDEKRFQKLFERGTIEEKEFVITKMRDRVLYLIDLCPVVPMSIKKKYCKDLVDLLDDGFESLEIIEE